MLPWDYHDYTLIWIHQLGEMQKRLLTGLKDADDPVHCMDQLQVHSPHVLKLQLLQAREPSQYSAGNHSHTCSIILLFWLVKKREIQQIKKKWMA